MAKDGVGGGDFDEALRGGGVVGVVVWVVEGGEGVELSRGGRGGVSVGGKRGVVWGVTKEEKEGHMWWVGKMVLFYGGRGGMVRDLEGFVGVDVIGVPWLRGVEGGGGEGARRAEVEGVSWEEGKPRWHSSCWCDGVGLVMGFGS